MEKELNIVEILKNKPEGISLYSSVFGGCVYRDNCDNCIEVVTNNCYYFNEKGHYITNGVKSENGECLLFPSNEMRDWSKFSWKNGDVLICKDNTHIIFEKFEDNTYKRFKGKYYLWKECDKEYYSKERTKMLTSVFEKANDDDAQTYIKTIEKKLGGKFNRETLEVEQPHPEFKDGDIITITPQIGNNLIFIFRAEDVEKYYCHAFLDGNIAIVNDDGYCKKDFCTARPSTEEEQKHLFEALAKKNKAWDAEKKAIVDLKPKWNPKPFDKVITRVDDDAIWTANIFSHIDQYGEYNTIGCVGGYPYCLPYNEETAKLIGTTDDWKG